MTGYTPFVPREPGSLLWSSIAQEVHILPNEVIEPVVLFFSQLETIRYFVEDLRSEQFAGLESARKIAMLQDYVRMMKYLVLLADEAERALAHSLRIDDGSVEQSRAGHSRQRLVASASAAETARPASNALATGESTSAGRKASELARLRAGQIGRRL